MDFLITVAGIALLLAGGDGLVRGAVGIARRAGISPFVVGLTIVGFGTSAPELVVSVDAALSGAPGIAVGNVVGSNIANMMLIIGAAALVRPLAVHRDALRRDGTVMFGATALFVVIAVNGTMTRIDGAGLIGALLLYIGLSLWRDARMTRSAAAPHDEEPGDFAGWLAGKPWLLFGVVVAGLAALVVGSRFAVTGATGLARSAGISEEVIGITLIAFGTSLPELATALVAARRGQTDVSVGNIIGSNIFNLLGIAGAAAIAAPLPFRREVVAFDIWALLAMTLILIIFMLTGRRVQRWEGGVLLVLYATYLLLHFLRPAGLAGP